MQVHKPYLNSEQEKDNARIPVMIVTMIVSSLYIKFSKNIQITIKKHIKSVIYDNNTQYPSYYSLDAILLTRVAGYSSCPK